MTNEEWKKLQDVKTRYENIRIASKRIENALRHIVFSYYSTNGRDKALGKLDSLLGDANWSKIEAKITAENVRKIEAGLKGELSFFDSLRDRFHLVPTLDAGCSFDFVGMIDDDDPLRDSFGGKFVRIDVTTNIDEKKKREVISCFGQKQWPYVFAHVQSNEKKVDFYDEKFDLIGDSQTMNRSTGAVREGASLSLNVRYQCVRRERLEGIQTHEAVAIADCKIPDEGTDNLSVEQQRKLDAQVVFFLQYRYALNVVPALEAGEFTDFIGDHDGELVRYLILTSIKDYRAKIRPSMEKLSKGRRYKIALFDGSTKMFSFFDWDHWYLLDDMPDWS